jgi:hypothetical protein
VVESAPLLSLSDSPVLGLWVPKLPSESFKPEFYQIDEFNIDSAFVNSDNGASHCLGTVLCSEGELWLTI